MSVALVIETDPTDDARRLGAWLREGGLELTTLRPYAAEPLPEDLTGYAALVVLGREQPAYPTGGCESLLRRAVRTRVPTLGIGFGAHLLATAHGGAVAPAAAGPELGPALVARRDVAESDPLFARVPFAPDVIQWHHDEIAELPVGAVLLAASTRYPYQAFRIGPAAWGLQFHIEPDLRLLAGWAAGGAEALRRLGREPDDVLTAAAPVLADMADVWQPFAARFAALARGELTGVPSAASGRSGAEPAVKRPEPGAARHQLPLLGEDR